MQMIVAGNGSWFHLCKALQKLQASVAMT